MLQANETLVSFVPMHFRSAKSTAAHAKALAARHNCSTHHPRSAPSRTTHGRGERLNLVLRGEMFRVGDRNTRLTTGNMAEQWSALHSIRKYVATPLVSERGRTVLMFADVRCDARRHAEAALLLRQAGVERSRVEVLSTAHQADSWLSTLAWMRTEQLLGNDALFCRVDTIFHGIPPWPATWTPTTVLFPW